MQENRSTDHYFGTMRGVRGFADKAALRWANNVSVFDQPAPSRRDRFLSPYRINTAEVDTQSLPDNDHSWLGAHAQWAKGANNGFASAGTSAMAYFDEDDIPFTRALARAFTLCDNYFSSLKGPTMPNRLYHWTGTIDPTGLAGGPALPISPAYQPSYRWTTYPERLQRAGVSWQVYSNDEVGNGLGEDGWVGDFGVNPLWRFQAYHDALASTDPVIRSLADRASLRTQWKPNSGLGHDPNHVLAQFAGDCAAGTLPQVSWIIPPAAYSEHPTARPADGAAYVHALLAALWANPDLWSKTAVIINYDEHDGFFDHVIPPTAPWGTAGEFIGGRPIGLGARVPAMVISPWSRGGWINSQVFDHTSVLRLLETWTGVRERNISGWRRSICGDLTNCFDFATADVNIPLLPDTLALRHQAAARESGLSKAFEAAVSQRSAVQQTGTAPARALPYQPWANLLLRGRTIEFTLGNRGTAAVQLQIYDRISGASAQRIDVAAGRTKSTKVSAPHGYDVAVYGPNGFLRQARGTAGAAGIESWLRIVGTATHPTLQLRVSNWSKTAISSTVQGAAAEPVRVRVPARSSKVVNIDPLATKRGWYDLSVRVDGHRLFVRHFAGHLENGRPSVTG